MILSGNPFLNMKLICKTVWDDKFLTFKYQVVWWGGAAVFEASEGFLRVDFCEVL